MNHLLPTIKQLYDMCEKYKYIFDGKENIFSFCLTKENTILVTFDGYKITVLKEVTDYNECGLCVMDNHNNTHYFVFYKEFNPFEE